MKKIWIMSLLIISSSVLKAQMNLVPNPSFEDTIECPSHGNNIGQTANWLNCGITPDYYNACANASYPLLGVPNSSYTGFQSAYEGVAYAGFATYQFPAVAHEFIGVQLIQPLNLGTKYYASCFISKANNYNCAANNFGFRFFMNMPFDAFNPAPIDNFSHIHSNVIVTDTLNWTKIAGSYIADSAYQYLVIGNFYDNVNTGIINCDTFTVDQTYYLIDAVCVSTDSLTCISWTGIKDNYNVNFTAFYNSTDEVIEVVGLRKDSHYNIINTIGMVVKKGMIARKKDRINLNSFSDGLYFISINNKTFKFVFIH